MLEIKLFWNFLEKLWIWIGTGTERKLFSYRWNGSELVPNIDQRIGTDRGPKNLEWLTCMTTASDRLSLHS